MTSARLAIAGVLAALFTVLGAGTAQAYPDPTIKISVVTPASSVGCP